jgi:hypothetical protein
LQAKLGEDLTIARDIEGSENTEEMEEAEKEGEEIEEIENIFDVDYAFY